MKAVFSGEHLEIRLFQSQSGQDRIITFWMNHFSKIIHSRLNMIVISHANIHLYAGLLNKKSDESQIQIEELFILSFKNFKKLILIIFKVRRGTVGRDDGSLMLLDPWFLIIQLQLRDRNLMSASFVKDRAGKRLNTICCIESATVSI